MNRRIIVFAAALAAVWPGESTSAQRVSGLSVAVAPSRGRTLKWRNERFVYLDTEPAAGKAPSLAKHVIIGAGVGLVAWGGYFLTTCRASCRAEGTRGEQLLMLPVALGIGASAGLVIGLLRHAQ